MKFAKMHGAGNDFVVVDAREADRDWGALARDVCDRHFGVGADGVILALPSDTADLRMRMFNPDGSEAEMCGNGIRCVAKFALERGIAPWPDDVLRIETLAGLCTVAPIREEGSFRRARVGMGVPRLRPEEVPVDAAYRLAVVGARESVAQWPRGAGAEFRLPEGELVLDWPLVVPGGAFHVTGVSMGNPHAVAFVDTPVAELALHEFGPQVEHHPLFPQRVNFEVVNVVDRDRLTARVWERGAGETMACGSGACAIAVAARLHGYTDETVDITLPGGVLRLTWDGQDQVYLEGPVAQVFEAEWSE